VVLTRDSASSSVQAQRLSRSDVVTTAEDLVAEYGGAVVKSWHRNLPAFLVHLDEEAAKALSQDPRVRLVEQNRALDLKLPAEVQTPVSLTPLAAPQRSEEPELIFGTATQTINGCPIPGPAPPVSTCTANWGLDRIDATSASVDRNNLYRYFATGAGVHVYVFDTGGTPGHPQFGGRYLDHDGSGTLVETASNSHGTRVASIIGGSISGVAKKVYFHVALLPGGGGSATTTTFLNAFDWIIEHRESNNIGPAVVNTSFNIPKFSDDPLALANTVTTAVSLAAEEMVLNHNLTLVVSAGNRDTQPEDFAPSDLGHLDGVIVVGGTDETDERWTRLGDPWTQDNTDCTGPLKDCGSNHSPGVDIWAPAAWIYGATSDGLASTLSGTSFAAPHVTGAVALYLQQNPSATPAQVEAALKANAQVNQLSEIGAAPNLMLNTAFIPNLNTQMISPEARQDFVSTPVDTALPVQPLLNDLDRNGEILTLISVSSPTANGGTVTRSGSTANYTPANNFTGSDSFTYVVRDSQNLTAQGTVHVTVTPDLPPVALPDHVVMAWDEVDEWLEGEFYGNDVDPESPANSISYVSHTTTADGTLERILGIVNRFRFTPDPLLGPEHTYSFTYRIEDDFTGNDGTVHEDTGTVFISTYDPVGTNLPTIQDDEFFSWGNPIQFNVLDNDSDNGTLTLESIHGEKNVFVYFQPDGTVQILASNPNPLRPGSPEGTSLESISGNAVPPVYEAYGGFTYLARDNDGNLGAGRVTVRINTDQSPVAQDDGLIVPAGGFHNINIANKLLANDHDPDFDDLTLSSFLQPFTIPTGASAGTLQQINDNLLRYTPTPGFIGEASFRYWVYDGWGRLDEATVYMMVGNPRVLYDDFEAGNLNLWDATTGNLAVIAAAAKEGTRGLRARSGAGLSPAYVTDLNPAGAQYFEAGFWFNGDQALSTLPVNTPQTIYALRQDSPALDALRLEVRRINTQSKAGTLQLRAVVKQDTGPDISTPWTNLAGWTWIELEWAPQPYSTSYGGSMTLSANGQEIGNATNVLNFQQSIDRARLGHIAPSGLTGLTSLYFDDYRTRR